MSSWTIEWLVMYYGLKQVAKSCFKDGVRFETAHLLLLGCQSRKWLLFGTRRVYRNGVTKEVPHLITEQPFKRLVVTKFS